MAAIKCGNCGAQIPDKAAFCPGCGQPKAAAKPVAQPAPAAGGGTDIKSFLDTILTTKMVMIGLFIGILIAWIARVIQQVIAVNPIATNLMIILRITFMVGVGTLLLVAGFLNSKYNVYIRAALVATGGVIVGVHI